MFYGLLFNRYSIYEDRLRGQWYVSKLNMYIKKNEAN